MNEIFNEKWRNFKRNIFQNKIIIIKNKIYKNKKRK